MLYFLITIRWSTGNFRLLSMGQPHSPNVNHFFLHSCPEGHQEITKGFLFHSKSGVPIRSWIYSSSFDVCYMAQKTQISDWVLKLNLQAIKFGGNDRAITPLFPYFLNKVNHPLPCFHHFFFMFHYHSCLISVLVSLQN